MAKQSREFTFFSVEHVGSHATFTARTRGQLAEFMRVNLAPMVVLPRDVAADLWRGRAVVLPEFALVGVPGRFIPVGYAGSLRRGVER